jgi:transglutaminase-like putative cysteine protease
LPWQREMFSSYLLPTELPESELEELIDFAMSFVKRNNYDLMAVLNDINQTLYREIKYVPGSTTLATTPYEVYVYRQGVCQDFANLFICLSRLLNIPARYRVGYLYTGVKTKQHIRSDASHAWVELYLPELGWFGFDPTNGSFANEAHIRIACGRHYRDATPTSGTIYKGGANETLMTTVQVVQLNQSQADDPLRLADDD